MEIRKEQLEKIRLLALDLDGTLLTEDKRISPRTAMALERAAALGIYIIPVTGRPLSGLPDALRDAVWLDRVITSNGAVTTAVHSGQVLRHACLDAKTAAEIAQIPMERGLVHAVFIDGFGYSELPFHRMQQAFFQGTVHEDYIRQSRRSTEHLEELICGDAEGVENIWFIARTAAERDELYRTISRSWDVRVTLTAQNDLEVGSPTADKGLAILALAESLGLGREQILAMGDNGNDLGLLRAAGLPVAMGNAAEEVRRLAAWVTADNESDGVAIVAEALLEARSGKIS